jgi:sedoheptulose-bisphosphatase
MISAAATSATTTRQTGAARVAAPMRSVASTFAGAKAALAPRSVPQTAACRAAPKARASVAVRAKIGQYLEEFLMENITKNDVRQTTLALAEASRAIAHKVRTASCDAIGCVNSFGDNQLAVDVLADNILFEVLRFTGVVYAACSEEVPEPVDMEPSADLCVAFDPLDGSSIVDTNFSVGTIFGVYRGKALKNITGRDLEMGGMTQYGPRTTFCVAFKDAPHCYEFLLQDDGRWVLVKETSQIGEGKMFSPGNLRGTTDNVQYGKLIQHYIAEKYTLRYTGGMVPDVFQIIVKEKGIFTNISSPSSIAKLRMVFEVAPIALLVEKAGGASSIDNKSALDKLITEYDQRSEIIYGAISEVAFCETVLNGKSDRFADKVTQTLKA